MCIKPRVGQIGTVVVEGITIIVVIIPHRDQKCQSFRVMARMIGKLYFPVPAHCQATSLG
jgi:hypothetical protein